MPLSKFKSRKRNGNYQIFEIEREISLSTLDFSLESEDEDEVVLSGSVLLDPKLHNCWLAEVGGQHAGATNQHRDDDRDTIM